MQLNNSEYSSAQDLVIDLEHFTCGHSRLGGAIISTDYFAPTVLRHDAFVDSDNGIEVGGENGRFDSAVVTIDRFSGRFAKAGMPLSIGTETKEEHVVSMFGPPYWTDRSDGETILFYEYRNGSVELQFEFGDGKKLSYITLTRNGVLAVEEQRMAYGVTRKWPPGGIQAEGVSGPGHEPFFAPLSPSASESLPSEGDATEEMAQSSGAATPCWRMPIWLHIVMETVIGVGGFLLGGALTLSVFMETMTVVAGWLQGCALAIPVWVPHGIAVLFSAPLMFAIPLLLSRWFRQIPARCGKCDGRAFAEGHRPVRYRCQECGWLKTTNVNSNLGPD